MSGRSRKAPISGSLDRYRMDERRAFLRIPGAMRMNRRELAILSELVKLRDRIARERDTPLKYVIPDDVIAGLAGLRPKTIEDLAQLRRLDAGARRNLGDKILEAVARGEAVPDDALPEKPQRPLGQARDTLASVMGVVVGEIARAERTAPEPARAASGARASGARGARTASASKRRSACRRGATN